jgi:hypothetical protein
MLPRLAPRLLAVIAGLLGATGAARAAPDARVVAEAERRFQKGNALYQRDQYEEALRLYHAAYDLVPSPEILFNIGLAREKLLDYEGCALAFRQFLAESAAAEAVRERAADRMEGCRSRAEILVRVSSIPPGAALRIGEGDAATFRGRTPAELRLAPATYVFAVELPGHVPMTQTVVVDVGARPEVDFPLERLSSLTIEADVPGARVAIAGAAAELAPLTRELRAGTYRVRIFKEGHREARREVRLGSGQQTTLLVSLPALPVERTVSIRTSRPANVHVDGRYLGTTPLSHALASGPHRVELAAPGSIPFARDISVPADRDSTLHVRLSVRRSQPQRALTWTLAGTALAAGAAGTTFAILAARDQNEFERTPSLALAERGEARAWRADVLWGTALALAASAFVHHALTRPTPARMELQ